MGAGTILDARQADEAAAAGAQFLVSPGSTPALLDAMDATGLPYLPGTSTVSEMLAVAERGHTAMKFFPAEAAGGAPYLASLSSPLPQLRFCPTGGITAAAAGSYLALSNVGCVGRLLGDPGGCSGRGRLGPGHQARRGGRHLGSTIVPANHNGPLPMVTGRCALARLLVGATVCADSVDRFADDPVEAPVRAFGRSQ